MKFGGSHPRKLRVRGMQATGFLLAGAVASGPAAAGSFSLYDFDVDYQLQATYAAAMRLHDPDKRLAEAPPAATIPLPDYFKVSESWNYDDGNNNFKKNDLINNRLTLLGEFAISRGDFGVLARGDAFYDDVYMRKNSNNSPEPFNSFTQTAEDLSGRRKRLLDFYAFGTWYLSDETALSLRIGRHIAAWGESLFHAGIALAQAPADATKANIPGADVKSILLPVNQISLQMSLNDQWTLLGQYKLEYKSTELNPTGEYFSIADVVGPGAEFIWGIENPLFLANLSDVNLLSDDVGEALGLVLDLLAPGLPVDSVIGLTNQLLGTLDGVLPDLNIPFNLLPAQNSPQYINVQRKKDIVPSDHGQWGLGLKYQVTPVTNVGLYHLRYHNTTPAPVQNYGYTTLLNGPNGQPLLTTQALGLLVPVDYNITYFDGIHMTAMSFSTALFGANVGGEFIYRDGVDVLVDVNAPLLGPVPTPVRAKVAQVDLNALYTIGPASVGNFSLWDSFTIVGDIGYISVLDRDEGVGNEPDNRSKVLTYSKDAVGTSFLFLTDRKNIFNGWDLQIPIAASMMLNNQSSLLSGFGPLMGSSDKRLSVGANFTYLQKLTLGVTYSGYFGTPDLSANPYADRDYLGFTAKYNF